MLQKHMHNGSGKSTLLQPNCGILKLTSNYHCEKVKPTWQPGDLVVQDSSIMESGK